MTSIKREGNPLKIEGRFDIIRFESLTDRPTYKIFIEKMLIYERNFHRRNQYSLLIRGEENHIFNIFTFLPFVA